MTALEFQPVRKPIALTVVVVAIDNGVVYSGELAVGVLPSTVYRSVAFAVVVLRVTV